MAKLNTSAVNSFLDWADQTFPGSKNKILAASNINQNLLDGLGSNGATPPIVGPLTPPPGQSGINWWDKTLTTVLDTASKIIPAYTNYNLQKDAYKIQLERAKQGQQPLDLSQYGTMPVRIQHGIDPGQLPAQMGMDDKTKNALMIGGGIIAAIFILPKLLNNG